MRLGTVSLFSMLLLIGAAACGDGGSGKKNPTASLDDGSDGGSVGFKCIDNDEDGYGKNCEHARDCNDEDPSVTDECFRCRVPNQDCPCDRGTLPVGCKPEDKVADGGVFQCKEGNRYCRDGYWSRCEEAGNYVFVPN